MSRLLEPLLGPGKMNYNEWLLRGCRLPHWSDNVARQVMERANPPMRFDDVRHESAALRRIGRY